MKKASQMCYTIFGWGVYISVFAGALCFLGFVVALIIGGDTAGTIAVAIKSSCFPLLIKLASVSVGIGLIGMYLGKDEALSITSDKKDAEEDLQRNLEEAKKREEDHQ